MLAFFKPVKTPEEIKKNIQKSSNKVKKAIRKYSEVLDEKKTYHCDTHEAGRALYHNYGKKHAIAGLVASIKEAELVVTTKLAPAVETLAIARLEVFISREVEAIRLLIAEFENQVKRAQVAFEKEEEAAGRISVGSHDFEVNTIKGVLDQINAVYMPFKIGYDQSFTRPEKKQEPKEEQEPKPEYSTKGYGAFAETLPLAKRPRS